MKIIIDKELILEAYHIKPGFMVGVNKGFHDSPLPTFAVKNYSDLDTLKKSNVRDDVAIAQDLGLRISSQMLSKATVGGLTYGGLRVAQEALFDDQYDLDSNDSKLVAAVPAVASAWIVSDKVNSHIPTMHKNVFKKHSIYK